MIKPSYDEIRAMKGDYTVVPLCRELYADTITPIALLGAVSRFSRHYFLLESVAGDGQWSRYSFLGYDPVIRASCKRGVVTIRREEAETQETEDPLDAVRRLLSEYKSPRLEGLPPFTGGFVGYFSYEMIGYAEPRLRLKESEFDDFDLMLFDRVVAYDHLKQKLCLIVNFRLSDGPAGYGRCVRELERLAELIRQPIPFPPMERQDPPRFTCNLSRAEYGAMVERAKEYIRSGDIFQAVLSRRFEAEYDASLLYAYRVLRATNPSPYMYFLRSGDLEIAGSSPETLVKLNRGRLTTFPIAGTRPRGATFGEDAELERELLADEKELSEHNMLVDLARNDLGRVSRFGSVSLEEYLKVYRYSRVMHIVSVVASELAEGKDACDAVRAMLPAGTLSGAPKFRACQIIDELEPAPRGVYGGAVGYLDFSGNLDICITIRTAVKKGGRVYVQAGAGIVADSVPDREYEECGNKAMAVIRALERAGEVND